MGINLSILKRSSQTKQLNEDLMFIIFQYFSLEELLLLSEVCIEWQTIINRLMNRQKSLLFSPVKGLPFEECCQTNHQLLANNNNRSMIAFNRNYDFDSTIIGLISRCLSLKSINLVGLNFNENCSPFRPLVDYCDSDLIHCNFAHLHNKTNLDNKRININSEEIKEFVEKFPNIVHFNSFRSWFRFSEESITQLISGLKKLEFIGFAKETDCTKSDSLDANSGDYFQYINPDIQVIKVTNKILGQNGLNYLTKRVKSLKELRINSIDSIDDLKLICQHFKSLKCLSFGFEISAELKSEAFRLMSNLNDLEVIDIQMSEKSEENEITSDSCLLELMSKTPKMKTIIIRGKITEASIQFIDRYWPQLEKLEIKSKIGAAISPTIIPNIAKLKNLNYLDLSDSNITDDDIFKIIFAKNRLRFLNLSGTRITMKTINVLIEKANSMPNEKFEMDLRRTSVSYLSESINQMPHNLLTHLTIKL